MGQSQATNWNTRSEPEEVTNVILNTVSFQLHILSFSSDSCSQLVLLETVRRFYLKKNIKKTLEKDTVFFLLCFFILVCLPLKGYSQNLITNFNPVQIKRSLKNINFVIRCFPKKQGHSQQIQHPYLHEKPNSLFLTCNTYFARANIEIT